MWWVLPISMAGSYTLGTYFDGFTLVILVGVFITALVFIYWASFIKPHYMASMGVQPVEIDVPNQVNEIDWLTAPKQRDHTNCADDFFDWGPDDA